MDGRRDFQEQAVNPFKEARSVMEYRYTAQYDALSGLWQILSRSGHVVYQSGDGDYVRSLCRELCNWRSDRQPAGAGQQ